MKFVRPVLLAAALTLVFSAAWAADQYENDPNHRENSDFASKAPKTSAGTAAAKETMSKMDAQMKNMHDMHEKMMNAKTPEERQALMADRMKTMQDGMAMMGGGMGGMGGMGQSQTKGQMPADTETRQQMMEKRMQMMESMMQMMMDRMPVSPAK